MVRPSSICLTRWNCSKAVVGHHTVVSLWSSAFRLSLRHLGQHDMQNRLTDLRWTELTSRQSEF